MKTTCQITILKDERDRIMTKKQLGVIYGSRSCEHDVSIISAVQFMNAANKEKYDIIPIYISRSGKWYTGETLRNISTYTPFDEKSEGIINVSLDMTSTSGELITYEPIKGFLTGGGLKRCVIAHVDCMCIIMHGMNGEDGTLQGLLEMVNIPYTSSGVAGSAIGMDKIMMKQFFRGANLPVLDSVWFTRRMFETEPESVLAEVMNKLSYPVFVKPANLGSSIGVKKANDNNSLRDALEVAFSFDKRVLVEKALRTPLEVNCSVLGYDGKCVSSVLEMPNTNGEVLTFEGKYNTKVGTAEGMASLERQVPAPISETITQSIKQMSESIFAMLDCKGVVRIDYMMEKGTESYYITEINTIPGSMAFYLWEHDGMKYSELIDKLVEYAFQAHTDKNKYSYAYTSDILNNLTLGTKNGGGLKGGMKSTGEI